MPSLRVTASNDVCQTCHESEKSSFAATKKSEIGGGAEMQWLKALDEADRKGTGLIWTLFNALISCATVAYCWIAIAQRKPSVIAGRIYRTHALDLWITFLVLVVVVELLFYFSVWREAKTVSSSSKKRGKKGHGHRVALGDFWSWAAAVFEIVAFRALYAVFQIHFAAGIAPKVTTLVIIEDIGIIAVALGFLRWIKGLFIFRIAKVFGVSLAPVIGVDSHGALVLADGSRMPRGSARQWPIKGIGRARIALVTRRPMSDKDIVITQDGDRYILPKRKQEIHDQVRLSTEVSDNVD